MNDSINQNALQVINFSTRDCYVSIDIKQVYKVISLPRLGATPTGPNYLIGLFNLEGTIVPVIDLSMRLHMNEPEHYSLDTPILICQPTNKRIFGVIVDKVFDVVNITEDMIQRKINDQDNDGLVIGAIKYEHFISLLINANYIIDDLLIYACQTNGNIK